MFDYRRAHFIDDPVPRIGTDRSAGTWKHLVQTVLCDNFKYVLCGCSSTFDYPKWYVLGCLYPKWYDLGCLYIYVYCILYMCTFTCNHPDSGVFGDVVVPETWI